jgi:hypothetical protein
VHVFRQKFTLDDAIGSHACSLEANMQVTNGIPLGCPLLLPVHTANCAQTLKAQLYKGLDPALRIQQTLVPASNQGPTWKAVEPLVDAWVWQGPQITGWDGLAPGMQGRIEAALTIIAAARRDGKQAYVYNNELSIIDLSAHRTRTWPWQIWRTNYAYPVSRHAGLQGSGSWYALNTYFGSDPWKHGNVLCAKPLGAGAHPIPRPAPQCPPQCGPPGPPPPPPPPNTCLEEREAGSWFLWYPPSDGDECHSPPVTSIRWELFRQGLEDVEYLAMLDGLAGL